MTGTADRKVLSLDAGPVDLKEEQLSTSVLFFLIWSWERKTQGLRLVSKASKRHPCESIISHRNAMSVESSIRRAKAPSWLRLNDGPSEVLVREGWVRLRERGRLNLLVRGERLAKIWSK